MAKVGGGELACRVHGGEGLRNGEERGRARESSFKGGMEGEVKIKLGYWPFADQLLRWSERENE